MPDPMPSANPNRTRRPPYDPPRYRPRRSRLLLVGLPVFAIFAAFASIVWLAYVDGAPGSAMGEPPLIKAEVSPLKLPPEDPGGRVVADQGEVRELFRDEPVAQPELLLPRPEQPITGLAQVEPATPEQPALAGAAPAPEAPAQPGVAGATQGAGQTGAPAISAETVQEDAEAALDALLAEVLESRSQPDDRAAPAPEVETAARAPAAQPAAPAEPEPPAAPTTDVRPAVAAPAPPEGEAAGTRPARAEREPEVAAIAPGEPVAERPPALPAMIRPEPREPEQQAARVEPPQVPVQPAPAALASTSPSYRIQLAAVREESDARRAWDLFQLDLGDVLRSAEPIIERADTANGIFYRVQVGPFANLAAAETLCDQLKQRNASCFVIRR